MQRASGEEVDSQVLAQIALDSLTAFHTHALNEEEELDPVQQVKRFNSKSSQFLLLNRILAFCFSQNGLDADEEMVDEDARLPCPGVRAVGSVLLHFEQVADKHHAFHEGRMDQRIIGQYQILLAMLSVMLRI